MKNRIIKVLYVACLTVLFFYSSVLSVSAEEKEGDSGQAAEQGSVEKKVVYAADKGYLEQSANGSVDGIIVDYLNEIAKYTGWQYEYIEAEKEDLTEMLADGSADLIGGAYYDSGLTSVLSYPAYNIGRSRILLLARWEDERVLNNEVDALAGRSIGIAAGETENREYLEAYLSMYHIAANIREFSDAELQKVDLGTRLESGEIDIMVSGHMADAERFRTVDYIDGQPCYIVCGKGEEDTLDALNFALHQISLSNPNFAADAREKNFPDVQNMKFYLTEEEEEYLREKKVLRVLVPDRLYPLCVVEEVAEPIGILPDFLDKITEITGIQIEYIPFDSSDTSAGRVAQLFNETGADVVGAAVANAEVFNNLGLSICAPYISLPRTFIRNKHFNFRMEDMTLAMIKRQRVPSNLNPREIIYCDNLQEVLRTINSGEADLGFSSTANIQFEQQQEFYPNIVTVAARLDDVEYCFATDTSGDLRLFSILNKIVNAMPDEEMQQLRENHLQLPGRSNWGLIRELIYNNALKMMAGAVVILGLIIAGVLKVFHEKMKSEKAALQLADAQSANRAKSVFLSHMSHDIRTPINGIIGMTYIAVKNLDNPDILKESLDKIAHASAQLNMLVNEVLEMSRIESGKVSLAEVPLDIHSIQKDVDSVISSMAGQAGIRYSFATSVKHPHLLGSPVYVERVMMNIITNAVKYTQSGGHVIATLEEEPLDEIRGRYILTVVDNGIGMSKEFLDHIFEPFSREHPDAGTTYTGTGLGMSITKELVEKMQGTIEIESELERGTTVVIKLPLKYDFSKQEEIEVEGKSLSGIRVLVVEDNELNSDIALYILQENGAEAELATNGCEAVEMFEEKPAQYYDVILMDLMMPVMDGYAAAKSIRAGEKEDAKSVPIIATTANAFVEDFENCIRCGMNDHVAKPLNVDELLMKIRKYCKKMQAGERETERA